MMGAAGEGAAVEQGDVHPCARPLLNLVQVGRVGRFRNEPQSSSAILQSIPKASASRAYAGNAN